MALPIATVTPPARCRATLPPLYRPRRRSWAPATTMFSPVTTRWSWLVPRSRQLKSCRQHGLQNGAAADLERSCGMKARSAVLRPIDLH